MKHNFIIRNPVHSEAHACFTIEGAGGDEDAKCAVRGLTDTGWSMSLEDMSPTGANGVDHPTFRFDPTSGARGILYHAKAVHADDGLRFRSENASETQLFVGNIDNDPDYDWPSMDFRQSRWYAIYQYTRFEHDILYTECPPDPAHQALSIDAETGDTGSVPYSDCTQVGAWRDPVEIGDDETDERHPMVAADTCGNVFVAYMNRSDLTIEMRYRCDSGPDAYVWQGPETVSDTDHNAAWYYGRNGDPMAWTPFAYDDDEHLLHVSYVEDEDDGGGADEDWQVVWARRANPCGCS